jgi:hypothetical protein
MYHVALCTSSNAHFDLTEPELEFQEEQSSSEYSGPQATSCVGTNLALDQGKLWCI